MPYGFVIIMMFSCSKFMGSVADYIWSWERRRHTRGSIPPHSRGAKLSELWVFLLAPLTLSFTSCLSSKQDTFVCTVIGVVAAAVIFGTGTSISSLLWVASQSSYPVHCFQLAVPHPLAG